MSKDPNLAADRFRDAAARSLAKTSPAVAAHLMHGKSANATSNSNDSVFVKNVCQRCGTVQIPGRTSTVKVESSRKDFVEVKGQGFKAKNAKSHAKTSAKREKWLRVECGGCHAIERTPLEPSSSPSVAKKPVSKQPTSSKGLDATGAKATASQSSKARAKARRGGLQAMIARPKDSVPPSGEFGLDLMDFMMKDGG